MKNELRFYFAVFMRRFHYFAIVATLIAAAAITIARLLPPVFVASANLVVEASQIPDELAAPTVRTAASEELQIIRQKLMTRANLLEIARKHDVLADAPELTPDQIVNEMRSSTKIIQTSGRGQANFMEISFEARSGRIAQQVVNEFVTIVLQENVEARTDRAEKTLEFFEVEVERLGNELEQQSAKILEYKNANSDALPETLDYRLTQQAAIQTQLATARSEIKNLHDQKRRLVELFEATGSLGPTGAVNLTPDQRKLQQLEDSLTNALAVYAPENPKVKLLEAQVAQQRAVVEREAGITGANSVNSAASILNVQLADIDGRIEVLEDLALQLDGQLKVLVDSIERTPGVTIALDGMQRDYNNTQSQYNRSVDGLSKAATGERIELLAKGRRIAVIDPATVPNEPSKPNRILIAVGGTTFGILAGLALVFAIEFLNSSIRRPTDIRRNLGITPLATVPYVYTPLEMVMRRAVTTAVFVGLVAGLPLALYAVHTYYLPLDLIYEKIAARIGNIL